MPDKPEPLRRPVCCPANKDGSEIQGCGGTNLDWEGEVWDCLDCGIWIEPDAKGVEWTFGDK